MFEQGSLQSNHFTAFSPLLPKAVSLLELTD